LVAVVLLSIVLSYAHQCTFNSTHGYSFDFKEMRELGDLTISNPSLGTFYFQVCSEVVSHCGTAEASVCIKSKQQTFNAGSSNDALWQDRAGKEDEGVTIIYSNGDVCGADGSKRKTIVQLQCYLHGNPLVKPKREVDPFAASSYISFLEQSDGCTTRLTVLTPFACATNKKYTTVCNVEHTRDSCFSAGSGCECAWCNNKCVASYEKCEGIREMQCEMERGHTVVIHSGVLLVVILTSIPLLALLACMCCCTCFRRRQLKNRLDNKLRLPVTARDQLALEEVAMEPLLMQQMEQPQYVFVQYPMPTGQHNPPLFAPNPVYVYPQYTQPAQP